VSVSSRQLSPPSSVARLESPRSAIRHWSPNGAGPSVSDSADSFFFNPSGRNLAGRCIRPGPDGGGVAAGGSAGVAGRRGEARAAGARGGRKEARRGRGGQPPDGGGGADDGAAHQGPPRRVPRLRVQAQGELEVRGFDTLSPFFLFILASMGGSDPSLLVMAFCHDSRGGVVLDVRAVVLLFFSSLRMFEH
jgi:hypothetical protein